MAPLLIGPSPRNTCEATQEPSILRMSENRHNEIIKQAYENIAKEECFEKDTIWHHTLDCKWAAPTFIAPKKTGNIRIATDFQELNKAIVCQTVPIAKDPRHPPEDREIQIRHSG